MPRQNTIPVRSSQTPTHTGKPQVRGKIERFLRTVNEMFLCDLEGYTRRGLRKPKRSGKSGKRCLAVGDVTSVKNFR